jgi:hypothetical protein
MAPNDFLDAALHNRLVSICHDKPISVPKIWIFASVIGKLASILADKLRIMKMLTQE